MKIIDLLNKIATGEDIPKKIKYNTFELKRTMSNNLLRLYVDEEGMFFPEYYSGLTLNDEVETLDNEEDKDIPLIPDDELFTTEENILTIQEIDYNFRVLREKINQVVEEFNEYRKENK